MKIQGVNNNNNLSYKAYFKQNETFKTLYKSANKNELFLEFANKCKKELPSHEIEITEQFATGEKWGVCKILNNTTKKIASTLIPNSGAGLLAIMAHLLLIKNVSDFFVEGNGMKDIDCYDILTKKD